MINLRSQREINGIRLAGLVVWKAHQLAGEMVRPGVTTAEINDVVEEYFESCGALPLFKGVPGAIPFPAACCISVNEEIVHGIPGPRVLHEGDIVSVDTGCKVNGWCADSAYTWPVGQVSVEVKKLLDVTERSLYLAIDRMKTAQRWSQVAADLAQFVRENGFSIVEEFSGHGVGREMHEDPQAPNFTCGEFEKNHDFALRPGLVIAIEPMVNLGDRAAHCLADRWTQAAVDRKPSAHFEHTVAVTKEGPRILTGPPEAGEVVP